MRVPGGGLFEGDCIRGGYRREFTVISKAVSHAMYKNAQLTVGWIQYAYPLGVIHKLYARALYYALWYTSYTLTTVYSRHSYQHTIFPAEIFFIHWHPSILPWIDTPTLSVTPQATQLHDFHYLTNWEKPQKYLKSCRHFFLMTHVCLNYPSFLAPNLATKHCSPGHCY